MAQTLCHHSEYELLGNLTFHLGLMYFIIEKQKEVEEYMNKAKILFMKVFPSTHNIFKTIKEYERGKKSV
jgi:hypothetical protein